MTDTYKPEMVEVPLWQLHRMNQLLNIQYRSVAPEKLKAQGFFGVDGIRVEWMDGYDNHPKFCLRLSESTFKAARKGLLYEQKDNLYFAHKGGYVSFYCWSGKGNEGGFGGSTFPIKMIDGREIELKGPWSSRSSVMNKYKFEPSTEVRLDVYKDPERAWDFTPYAGHISIAMLKAILHTANYPWWLAETTEVATNPKIKKSGWDITGEISFVPVHRRGAPKGFFDQRPSKVSCNAPVHQRIKKFRIVAPVLTDWHTDVQYTEIDNVWQGI